MYVLFIAFSLCIAYLLLLFLFAQFFRSLLPRLSPKIFYSMVYIVMGSLLFFAISETIPSVYYGNRVLHALGGGFMGFFVCFRVVQDSRLDINRFQFFIFGFLIVTAMGVSNEIFEFFLQNYSRFIFAPNINDTWLDLVSNLAGTLVGSIVFTPLIKRPRKS